MTIQVTALPLDEAPAADFPDADYAMRSQVQVPLPDGGVESVESYVYMDRTPNGDVPVGTAGQGEMLSISETFR